MYVLQFCFANSNFEIMSVMVVMIWWFCVLILMIMLLSLLRMLIIIVLFIRSSDAIRLLRNSVIDDCGYIEKCVLILRIESTTFVTTLSILKIEFRIILAIYESRKLRN